MQSHVAVRRQKLLHQASFVRGKVVQNDMHLSVGGLGGDDVCKKSHKLLAGMSGSRLPNHLAGLRIQRRIQRQSAMAVLFKAMPFSASGRKRKALVQTVQCLNSALLVHTKHRCIFRRI